MITLLSIWSIIGWTFLALLVLAVLVVAIFIVYVIKFFKTSNSIWEDLTELKESGVDYDHVIGYLVSEYDISPNEAVEAVHRHSLQDKRWFKRFDNGKP